MIDHYDAFISYRHTKRDSEVASRIHRDLERFKIPAKVRASVGKKKIERIFRDKEELPITSDLGEDIRYALSHADFLIVICSPDTAKSTWVAREIACFLETHPHNRILTVLSYGEPEQVILPQLRFTEEEVVLPDGTVQKQTHEIEPLSCDYRLPRYQAKKKELPRLAAAILGCSYDELVLRQRQYQRRRNMIITGAAATLSAGAIAYLLWSRNEIAQNLRRAQINQSHFLAEESVKAYEDHNLPQAKEVALEALPAQTGNPERPIVSDAVKALGKALGAYTAPQSDEVFPGVFNLASTHRFTLENSIAAYAADPSGKYLAAIDNNNNLAVWEIASEKLLWEKRIGADAGVYEEAEGLYFPLEDRLILAWPERILALERKTGNALWEQTADAYQDFYLPSFTGDGALMVLSDDLGRIYYIETRTGETLGETDAMTCFYDIPREDGEKGLQEIGRESASKGETGWEDDAERETAEDWENGAVWEEETGWIDGAAWEEETDWDNDAAWTWDDADDEEPEVDELQTVYLSEDASTILYYAQTDADEIFLGKSGLGQANAERILDKAGWMEIFGENSGFPAAILTEDGGVLVSAEMDTYQASTVWGGSGFYHRGAQRIACIEGDTGKIRWQQDISCTLPGKGSLTDLGKGRILATVSDQAIWLDSKSGAVIRQEQMPGSILACDTADIGFTWFFMDNGYMVRYPDTAVDSGEGYDAQERLESRPSSLLLLREDGQEAPGLILLDEEEKNLLIYQYDVCDPDYRLLYEQPVLPGEGSTLLDWETAMAAGNYLVFPGSKKSDGKEVQQLLVLDPDEPEKPMIYDLPWDFGTTLLAHPGGEQILVAGDFDDEYQAGLVRVFLKEGRMETEKLPTAWVTSTFLMMTGKEKIYYYDHDENMQDSLVRCFDIRTGEVTTVMIQDPEDLGFVMGSEDVPSPTGEYLLSQTLKGHCLVNLQDGSLVLLKDGNGKALNPIEDTGVPLHGVPVSWQEDGQLLCIGVDNHLYVYNTKGELVRTIDTGNYSAAGTVFYYDLLAAIYSGGMIEWFSLKTGESLGLTQLDYSLETGERIRLEEGKDFLLLFGDDSVQMLWPENWEVVLSCINVRAYSPERREIYTACESETAVQVGVFPEYTVQSLIDKANDR